LQINDESRRNFKKDGDYSFEFNSFLTMFKQAAEENFNNNALQIQKTLEMVNNIGQSLRGIINEVFRNFEKLNLEYSDGRKNAAEVLELKIFLAAGKQFLDSLHDNEENISLMQDNQIAELERIFQKILIEEEGKTTNMMIECLGRFFPRLDQEFNRTNNASEEMLFKLNAQEEMIKSLLTKSGEEIKETVDFRKIERLCSTMSDERTFVKDYMIPTMNDQNTLIKAMVGDIRKAAGVDQLRWLNSNFIQVEDGDILDMVVQNIPQCFNGIRRLIIKHSNAMNNKIKTLNDQLKLTDRTQNQGMNVIGAQVMVCLRKLGELEGGMEGMCLFLKGFVDRRVDMRRILEEAYMKDVEGVPKIEENAEKHVAVINEKLEELIDEVNGILRGRNQDMFELVNKEMPCSETWLEKG
jgi:hypothetical protein